MTRRAWFPGALSLAAAATAAFAADGPMLAPSIVHIALQPESEQRFPVIVPTEPDITLELEFPWPLADWIGRGFTPEPEKYAGDFVIGATRGSTRLFVAPITAQAHRVLHVVLSTVAGTTVSVPIEFIPAPPGLSWRKIVFAPYASPPQWGTAGIVRLADQPPRAQYREQTPATRGGLVRTMQLLAVMPEALRQSLLAANPNLQWSPSARPPRSLGEFTLTVRFALRDRVTGDLGLCIDVSNATQKRLVFDRQSWIVRAGDRAYPARTAEFPGEIQPGTRLLAFLTLGSESEQDSAGAPTRLLPQNDFTVSVSLISAVDPRPVRRSPQESPDG